MDRKDRFFIWYGAAAGVLVLAYVLIFMATNQIRLWSSVLGAIANILPLALLGLAVRPLLSRLAGRPVRIVVLAILAMATAWSVLWYFTVAVTIGLSAWITGQPFGLVWLEGPALTWQAYQGLVVFALVCVGHLAIDGQDRVAALTARTEMLTAALESERRHRSQQAQKPATTETAETIMVRTPEGYQAIAARDILFIEAQDDDSIVHTRTKQFKARTALSGWADQLDPKVFARIHRSRIINLSRLISAEPLGDGRFMAHLEAGHSVETSRTGAKVLKALSA